MTAKSEKAVCGKCRRVQKSDLAIGWCPFRAINIHHCKPADRCVMYVGPERDGKQEKGDGNVR